MKIGILYICIGAYKAFWEGFYSSFEKHFIPDAEKHYFVFTDADQLSFSNNDNVHCIYQEDLGWPGNTIYRFKMFLKVEEELKRFDYLFFINANIVCKSLVSQKDFLPIDKDLLVVQQPGFYNTARFMYTYERRKESRAYISYMQPNARFYVCGGINGGGTDAFLKLIHTLDENIQADDAKGITAIWNDESHINCYITKHPNYRILSPAFAYPEGWELPFEEKFLILDKQKYIQLDQKKVDSDSTSFTLKRWQKCALLAYECFKAVWWRCALKKHVQDDTRLWGK